MSDSRPDLSRLSIDRDRPRSGGRGGWWVALVLLLLFAGYVAWRETAPGASSGPLVRVELVARSGRVLERTGTAANGYVVARRRAALSTDIQGRIVEMLVEEGDRVEAGQLVARLDTRQLEASANQARADLERARATEELATLEHARHENLVATGDTSISTRDMKRATRDEAVAQVAALEARLAEIEVMLYNSSVYAPFSGVITAKNAEVGEVVSAIGATGPNARGAVATLVDFDTLEVQVELAQTSLGAARIGAPVTIYLDAFPDDGYRGEVRQIWPTADRQKGTVEVRAGFLDRDDRILPEMGVRVVFLEGDLPTGEEEGKVFVSEGALRGEGDDRYVFLLRGERVERRSVVVGGDATGGRVTVSEGLVGGERVVVGGPADLEDGMTVTTETRP